MNATEPSSTTMLPLAKIRPGQNPRRYFDKQLHDELVASFRVRGMLQPMLVRPAPNGEDAFILVAGGRRYRAALEAFGAEGEAPVIVRQMSDDEALEAAIDENDKRADASETEQADAAVRVLAACVGDRAEAARRLAWSPAKLDRRLALANLSEPVKAALDERRIKVGHAELLAAVHIDNQGRALETILTSGIDVAKTRELLTRMTQDLGSATFDKTECAGCPFNSALQGALFETHVDDGHCTNAGCFQLKTEAAEKERAAAAPAPAPEPKPAETTAPAAPAAAGKAPTPAKPASPATTGKVKITAEALAARSKDLRQAAWRSAVGRTLTSDLHLSEKAQIGLRNFACSVVSLGEDFAHIAELARALEVDLRDSWQVNKMFLSFFNKDELKFIAQECGLIAHMGTKPFARLLEFKTEKIIDGMLTATGFAWAGRLPSAITLDGKYSPPRPAPAQAEPEPAEAVA